MLDWLNELNFAVLYPATLLAIVATGELGNWIGRRTHKGGARDSDIGTLTGASIGLVGLLLAFTFSIALARYDLRRSMVLEEANAIGSTANFTMMLPQPQQHTVLGLLRTYTDLRVGLGRLFEPASLDRDIARSVELQGQLWQQA